MKISLSELFHILPIHVYIIVLCILVGLITLLRKEHPPHIGLFTAYLFLTFFAETSGYILLLQQKDNSPIYNVYIIINFSYLIFLLRSFLQEEGIKKVLSWTIIVFVVIALINLFFVQKWHSFNTYTFVLGSIAMVICSIYYFYHRMKFPDYKNLLRDPTFWIATGLLFFYTCSLPIIGLINFVSNIPRYVSNSFYLINLSLNIILYSLFSISLLCSLIFRKSSS